MDLSEAEDVLAIHLKEMGIEFTREFKFYTLRKWRLDFYLDEESGSRLKVEFGLAVGILGVPDFSPTSTNITMPSCLGFDYFDSPLQTCLPGRQRSS